MSYARSHARLRLGAMIVAVLLVLAACSSGEPAPVVSNPPAPPAPGAIPADWTESTVAVPGTAVATYTAPRNPGRLRAALVLGADDRAGQVATREISVMLAHQGVASLRFDGALAGGADDAQAVDWSGRALTALAGASGLDDGRLLVMGHGAAAPTAMAVAAGRTGRRPMAIGLIEPVLSSPPAGAPDPLQSAMSLPQLKHNLLTCSDSDIAVDCSAVQNLADVLTGTHLNYVRLRGVSHALQEDTSRDPARYGAADLPFSASLNRSLGSWVSMQ